MGGSEEIFDLSHQDILNHMVVVTRSIFLAHNVPMLSIMDGDHLCVGDVEKLAREWKVQSLRCIAERDGVEQEPRDPDLDNLLYQAGSLGFTYQPVPQLDWHEKSVLIETVAPVKINGPEDTQEWNLFDSYLNAKYDEESLHERHNLISASQRWKHDVVL